MSRIMRVPLSLVPYIPHPANSFEGATHCVNKSTSGTSPWLLKDHDKHMTPHTMNKPWYVGKTYMGKDSGIRTHSWGSSPQMSSGGSRGMRRCRPHCVSGNSPTSTAAMSLAGVNGRKASTQTTSGVAGELIMNHIQHALPQASAQTRPPRNSSAFPSSYGTPPPPPHHAPVPCCLLRMLCLKLLVTPR